MRFHIAKTPHQYRGMRWSIFDHEQGTLLHEVCRCPSMSDASLICDALNHAAKDDDTWRKMLMKAADAFSRYENRLIARTASTSTSRTRKRQVGDGFVRPHPEATDPPASSPGNGTTPTRPITTP